jgi:hypothetical protein
VKTSIVFKEWLPDQPELNNPGLIEAKNVIPRDGGYTPFRPIDQGNLAYGTSPANPVQGGIWARDTAGSAVLYVGSQTALSARYSTGWTNLSAATYNVGSAAENWDFVQYDNLVIAAVQDHRPQAHTAGSTATSFTALSTSGEVPYASVVGVIGQFVVLGNTRQTTSALVDIDVRWSAIAQPRNWPTPNTATATATQSGQQLLNQADGAITGIVGNDQFGIIFQEDALTRMTYAGPPVVFQFDKFSDQFGCVRNNSIVHLNNKFYFIARSGVCVTDGVSVSNISDGRVSKWISENVRYLSTNSVFGAADPTRNIIMWGFPPRSGASGQNTVILIYNYVENRFSWAEQTHRCILEYGDVNVPEWGRITAFDETERVGFFSATAGSSVITTGDIELNPGGRMWVDGIKPQVEASAAPTIGVRLGYRSALDASPTYTSTTGPTSSTGFADFRIDAQYVRAEINVTGEFDKTSGFIVRGQPSSDR